MISMSYFDYIAISDFHDNEEANQSWVNKNNQKLYEHFFNNNLGYRLINTLEIPGGIIQVYGK